MSLPTFIHIPRTGGTTIAAALGYGHRKTQHKPVWAYDTLDRPWTIVRDPYERVVSLCAFFYRDRLAKSDRELTVEEFEQWLRDAVRTKTFVDGYNQEVNLYANEYYEISAAAPQMSFLDPRNSRQRKGWTEPVIEVFKFEDLRDRWGEVCDHVGVHVPYPAQNLDNTSRHGPVFSYYLTDYFKRQVESFYKRDFFWLVYGRWGNN